MVSKKRFSLLIHPRYSLKIIFKKMSVDLKFTIRYTGGIADESLLDLYDAATSMYGLSKALAITSNALVTRGQVRKRVDKIPNVKFFYTLLKMEASLK